jgi:glycosyltransferase involved in cell wall biosynthesis
MPTQTPPIVSIVLPTYKRAHVLPLAIRSVLEQTYASWELIVVDDNSPDETEAVVKSFGDPRIRYFRNDPNLKLPRTLNRGFSLAAGDYLTWTSDDNMLAPSAIARMVDVLAGGAADFVFADYYEFAETDAEGHPNDLRHVRQPDEPDLAKGNSIGACFLYTRAVYEQIGEYDPNLFLNEDYDYWMRIARKFRMKHIAEPLYYFRRDEDSLYCSRFSEVRAGSLLVRYKNRYLSAKDVLSGIVDLIVSNLDRHTNVLVRNAYRACKAASFRLTKLFERIARRMITRHMRTPVEESLSDYDEGRKTFSDARSALMRLMNDAAVIEYRGYVRPPVASGQQA